MDKKSPIHHVGVFYFMTDFSKTIIRCSAIGSIMSDAKGTRFTEKDEETISLLQTKMGIKGKALTANQSEKLDFLTAKKTNGPQLSDSCKKYLVRAYALEKYNRIKEEPITKQMVKGITCEEDSITLFSRVEKKFYNKNIQRLRNDFLSGTPDLYDGSTVHSSSEIIDIKSSWDISTFLNNIDGPLNPIYYWQLQGYMALSGAKIGTVAYCLVNMSDEMIAEEKRKLFYKMNVPTEENIEYKKACAEIDRNMIFDDIPKEERVLRFTVERNNDDIERIYKKVIKCREFLADFEIKHLFFTKNHRREKLLSLPEDV